MKQSSGKGWFGPGGYFTKPLLVLRSLLVCALLFSISNHVFAAEPPQPKNVLILVSFTQRDQLDVEPLRQALLSDSRAPVHLHFEYLESQRFGISGYRDSVSEEFYRAYGNQKFDLVITIGFPAFRFAVDYRDRLFPKVPIEFVYLDEEGVKDLTLPPNVTGVTYRADVRGTVDLALRLSPDTQTAAVVSGISDVERYFLDVTQRELRRHTDRVREIDLVGLATDELLRRVASLPPHTIVFFQLIPQASESIAFDILAAVSQRFPTYCVVPLYLDRGIMGASYTWPEDESEIEGGEVAARILSGERPENIPVVHPSEVRVRVDWRQLKKWNISESALPPGAIVLYRPPSFWELHKGLILTSTSVIVLQTLLIFGLLWQRARNRKIEASLRESEGRFRVMADTSPTLIWMCDVRGIVTYLSEKWASFTGGAVDRKAADGWMTCIHPDDTAKALSTVARALEKRDGFSREYRLQRGDGVYRWMFDVAAPRFDANSAFAGFIGSAIDITDQKLAQEALEKLSGRLIDAQEKERSRIARELHDDICQRLALLSMELEQANQALNGSADAAHAQLIDIRKHCAEIGNNVQALSHELHSSKLDYLGVAAAIRGSCKEFSKQHSVEVEFTCEDVPTRLPREVSLCLFRVAQEALHNALKHSGVTRFTVHMWQDSGEVHLEVSDRGKGFEVNRVSDAGLGLVSMKERAHLVNGTLSIESSPNRGTRISLRVPAPGDAAKAVAAGATSPMTAS